MTNPALTASYEALRRVLGSLFGLGGGCFRGEESPPPLAPSSLVWAICCKAGLMDGLAEEWTMFSMPRGVGTELERKWRMTRLPTLTGPSKTLPLFSRTLKMGWKKKTFNPKLLRFPPLVLDSWFSHRNPKAIASGTTFSWPFFSDPYSINYTISKLNHACLNVPATNMSKGGQLEDKKQREDAFNLISCSNLITFNLIFPLLICVCHLLCSHWHEGG